MTTDDRFRYFVTINNEPEHEVSMAAFVSVERQAGFHNTMGRDDLPATAGFSSHKPSTGERFAGRIELR